MGYVKQWTGLWNNLINTERKKGLKQCLTSQCIKYVSQSAIGFITQDYSAPGCL